MVSAVGVLCGLIPLVVLPVTGTEHTVEPASNIISRDAVFLGAATIMGLAAFGSVLTMRIHDKTIVVVKMIITVGLVVLIITQSWFMYILIMERADLDPWIWLTVTTICLVVVVIMVALMTAQDQTNTSRY